MPVIPDSSSITSSTFGAGNGTITLTLPYPFITQGATPIHIYSDVTIEDMPGGGQCFIPGPGISNSNTQVTLGSYSPQSLGQTTNVTVTLPELPVASLTSTST